MKRAASAAFFISKTATIWLMEVEQPIDFGYIA
jgi:hypothetical protein